MIISFTAVLLAMLFLIRPLQKNPFFLMYFGLMLLAAYYTETHWFKLPPLAYKTFLLFLAYHLAAINIVTFLAYGADKRTAVKGNWRTPEVQVHALELLGGSPAAFVAQRFFHHKTKKKSYQSLFWLVLILQIAVVYYVFNFLDFI